jgi:pimeloyl-ACP methyl ester carboxylesterase
VRRLLFALVGLLLSASLQAATVDGLRIHSSTTGTGPRTVILVHGYTCDESTWVDQVPELAKHYRVITLDLPGHGKSDVPAVDAFSMDLFARAIEAVRAEAQADRVVLVGHSMGTPVVLRYAHLYPQHTAALVFVDGLMPTARNPNPTGSVVPANAGAAMAGPDGRTNREAMIRRFFSTSTTPAMQTKILEMMLGAPEATAVGAMNATFEPAGQTDDIPTVPILGIYAGPSGLASPAAVHAHFPTAEYTQIPNTGHFLMLEKPEEFNRLLLAFLAKEP